MLTHTIQICNVWKLHHTHQILLAQGFIALCHVWRPLDPKEFERSDKLGKASHATESLADWYESFAMQLHDTLHVFVEHV